MKFGLYAVRDRLIGFGMPVIRDNDSVASRSFEYDCNLDNSPYASHPSDFQLYKIGDYDTDDGNVISCSPIVVASAVDFIKE